MNNKILTPTIFLLFMVMVMATILLPGCSGINLADATLSEATMCKSVDPKTRAPLDKISIFPPDFKEIHCNAFISNAPATTTIKAQFLDSKKSVMAEETRKFKGSAYVDFWMVRSKELWEVGDYSVLLYVNEKVKAVVPFKIQRLTVEEVPTFTEVTICKKIDTQTLKPLDSINGFPADFDIIYLSFKLNNAPADTAIMVRWFRPDDTLITEDQFKAYGTQYFGFSLNRTGNPWAPGTYSAALFMNGKADYVVPFMIK